MANHDIRARKRHDHIGRQHANRGGLRSDVPLRLLRSLVLGPMEQMLWEVVSSRKPIQIDAAAGALSALLWAAMATPGAELAALRALRGNVAQALDQAARV